MLRNAQGPDLLPKLEACGYPLALMEAKLAELQALRALSEAQAVQEGVELAAGARCREAFAALNADYTDHIRLARVVFKKDSATQTGLCLKGKRQRREADYISEGLIFYNNALDTPAIAAALSARGLSVPELTAGRDALEQYRSLREAHSAAVGATRQASKDKWAARAALQEWMNDFVQTAKVALRKEGQLIEALGIKVKS